MTDPRESEAIAALVEGEAPRASRASGRFVQRGLVIQTAFPGDVILSTPLIRRAAERLGAPVDVVTIPAAAPALKNNPHIRDIIIFDKNGADKGLGGFLRMAKKLRARKYAVAYLAQGSLRTGALAFAARIPRRIGFRGAAGNRFYTHAVMIAGEPHQIEKLLKLADGAPDRREPEIFPTAAEREAVDKLLAEAHIEGEFVALAPGSAWATKRWPYFPELARALSADVPLVIVGGPGDRADARAIKTAVGSNALIADGTGVLNMLASGELIRRSVMLVANDSAPVHLASAVNTPVIEIYGPTVPQFGFAARPLRSRIVEPDPLACRPCHHHGPVVCPLVHHKCMRDTPVSRVLAEVRTVLQIVRTRGRA